MITEDDFLKDWNTFWKNEGFQKKRSRIFWNNSFAFMDVKLRRSAYAAQWWPECGFNIKELYPEGEWDEKDLIPVYSSASYRDLNICLDDVVIDVDEKEALYLFPEDGMIEKRKVDHFFSIIKEEVIPELKLATNSSTDFISFINRYKLKNHCYIDLQKWLEEHSN